jgi:hypothetical protein
MVAGLQILSSGFLAYQSVKFITITYGEIQYLGGGFSFPKVSIAPVYSIQCLSRFLPEMIRITIIFGFSNFPTTVE